MTKGRYCNNGKVKNNLEEIVEPKNKPVRAKNSINLESANEYDENAVSSFVKSGIKADYLVDFPNSNYAGEKIYNSELEILKNIPKVNLVDYKKSYNSKISGRQAVIQLENGHVKELNIDEYLLDHLPNSLDSLTELNDLRMGEDNNRGNVFSLPLSIGNVHNLETLYVNYANFSQIPDKIKGLNNLKIVSFSNTLVKNIDNLYHVKSLEYVDLGSTLVESISPLIFNLNNLKKINLGGLKLDYGSKKIIELLKARNVEVVE